MPITIDGTNGISGVDGSAGTPSIQGSDTNTGVFYPAADTVAIATSGTEQLRLDSTGNLRFNSGYGSVVTSYGCRAWVNFNGTGTVAIRASGNVSSITDLNTGKYQVNFSTSMPDANYSAVAMMRADTDYAPTIGQPHEYSAQSSSSFSLKTGSSTAAIDSSIVTVAVFR
jgi:hypothetical protein